MISDEVAQGDTNTISRKGAGVSSGVKYYAGVGQGYFDFNLHCNFKYFLDRSVQGRKAQTGYTALFKAPTHEIQNRPQHRKLYALLFTRNNVPWLDPSKGSNLELSSTLFSCHKNTYHLLFLLICDHMRFDMSYIFRPQGGKTKCTEVTNKYSLLYPYSDTLNI